jgi:NADH:ubiquinone oxidoreductase subunit F (NADH-binding)
MPIARVLDAVVCPDLAAYEALGGGSALAGVRASGADGALASLAAAGLRGRGGAGFPTHEKWASIIRQRGSGPGSVVVNAAEGEPGTFKDRAILRANPYRVLEGALIAATIVGASEVVVAMKGSFRIEITRVGRALDELRAAGWTNGANCRVVLGPNAYLFGEETALLEVVEGRLPFPRVAPPYREGLPADSVPAPVALVNNVETFANVPLILANGPA